MSDIDSDCDDVFTEDSKGSLDNKSISGNEDNTRHMLNRKRRRGIIEKRRRDRINNSLSELRRLVPAAYEKQGSAKLEKAEILQLTVDHLRHLHSKGGFDMFGIESIKFLTDYHNVGFRECASEVARYLASFEGLDIQDPVKLRIMSHLQCFATRDVRSPHRIPRIPPCYPTTPAIPSFHYPQFTYGSSISDVSTHSTSSKSDRRPSSASSRSDRSPSSTSSMSVDSRTSSVEFTRSAHSLIPVSPIPLNVPAPTYFGGFSQSSVVLSNNPPKTPARTYRPWGTEIAY